MAPDDLMVYTGTATVPAVTSLASALALRGVYRKSIAVLTACIIVILTLLRGPASLPRAVRRPRPVSERSVPLRLRADCRRSSAQSFAAVSVFGVHGRPTSH